MMDHEATELLNARHVLTFAEYLAHCATGDKSAAVVAILAKALEIATPELSCANRARIFLEEE